MPTEPNRAWLGRPVAAVLAGGLAGIALLLFSFRDGGHRAAPRIELGINGVPMGLARDLLLPPYGWTLQVSVRSDPRQRGVARARRRAARGANGHDDRGPGRAEPGAGLRDAHDPRDAGHARRPPRRAGARATSATAPSPRIGEGFASAPSWEVRRSATRQIVHFDFEVDRDGDGRADFEQDLERLGLVSPAHPELAKALAGRIAERALARVVRAYDAPDDPNRTGHPRDPVAIRFQLDARPARVRAPLHHANLCRRA